MVLRWVPKWQIQVNKHELKEEQIRPENDAQSSLQTGWNKGATQSGIAMA
jgi:hypothetical protein